MTESASQRTRVLAVQPPRSAMAWALFALACAGILFFTAGGARHAPVPRAGLGALTLEAPAFANAKPAHVVAVQR